MCEHDASYHYYSLKDIGRIHIWSNGNGWISAESIFHILIDAIIVASVALLNKKTRAALLIAFVG